MLEFRGCNSQSNGSLSLGLVGKFGCGWNQQPKTPSAVGAKWAQKLVRSLLHALIGPVSQVIRPFIGLPIDKAVYRGEITPSVTQFIKPNL